MKRIRIVKIEPGQAPKITYIEDTLEAMLEVTGGGLEATYPWEDPVALVGNGLAKLIGMPPNFFLRDCNSGQILDIVCGPVFLCGLGEEDFTSLSADLAEKFIRIFSNADSFSLFGHALPVIPT